MTKIAQSTVAKAFVAFVAAAMIFTMFAAPAKAQTSVEDLQKMINDLMAQIAALQGTTTTGGNCAAIPTPLTIGAQNANVTALQNYLIAAGNVIPAGATGYFGTQTRTALAAWQAANGVAPAAGYYGPITAAAMAAKCVPSEGRTEEGGSTSDLKGGEGDIDVEILTDGPETIDLGKAEVVLEFQVEAVDSDVAINRVDFFFSSTTAPSTLVRPWLYFDEVNLMVDGKEVASLTKSSDFSDQGTDGYRARFSGLNIVLREDDTADVALELVTLNTMGGDRSAEKFKVSMNSDGMRFVDGAGLSETGGIAANSEIDFNDVFTDGEIRGTVSDSSPEKATIVLSENSRTNGVTILEIDLEARDSDMEVKSVTVPLSVSTGTTGGVFNRARLYSGSTLLSTKTVSGATTGPVNVIFDSVDHMIDEDDTDTLRVEVDFNNGGSIAPATITVGTVVVTAENSNFSTDTENISVGEIHNLIVKGLVATVKSISSTDSNDGKDLTINFKMDVTAYDEDFYINENGGLAFVATISGPGATTTVATSSVSVSGVTKNAQANYRIQRGQTREVTVSFLVRSNAGGFVQATLNTLRYSADATATAVGVAATDINLTDALGAPDFEVKDVTIVATTGL